MRRSACLRKGLATALLIGLAACSDDTPTGGLLNQDGDSGGVDPDAEYVLALDGPTCVTAGRTSDPFTALLTTTEGGNTTYALAARHQLAPGTDQLGTVRAISVETGRTDWLYEQRAATMSLVATGGGLLFGGDTNGRFRAFDQSTGVILWEINLGSPVSGYPITFAVDGRQYVAVSTGTAGNASINLRMTPELHPSAGNNLFVFALPESEY